MAMLGIDPVLAFVSGSIPISENQLYTLVGIVVFVAGMMIKRVLRSAIKTLVIGIGLLFIFRGMVPYFVEYLSIVSTSVH